MDDSKPSHEFAARLERVYFVYDPETGEVLGLHAVSTVRGGKPSKEADLERSTRSRASRLLKRRAGEIGLASLSGEEFDPGRTYRFDTRAKRLVLSAPRSERPAARNEGVPPAGKPPAGPEQFRF